MTKIFICHQQQCWGLMLPNSKITVTERTCLVHLHKHVYALHLIYKSPTFSWGHKYPTAIYHHCDKFTCLVLQSKPGHLLCILDGGIHLRNFKTCFWDQTIYFWKKYPLKSITYICYQLLKLTNNKSLNKEFKKMITIN